MKVDKVYQKPDEIQKNMNTMEQKIRESGHVKRKSAG